LTDGGVLAAFAGNWQVTGTWEYQPGALLDWGGQNIFFNGDLDDIALDNPTREEWFNIDAGFERDPAKIPAAFQKRAFPFRIDGVRGMPLTFTNVSIQSQLQCWRQQFGQVTAVALNQMRFFTFGARATF